MKVMLSELGKGREGILWDSLGEGPIAYRLRQFGMIEGTRIYSLGAAPLGSPMLFRVRGTILALRREDCRGISVVVE